MHELSINKYKAQFAESWNELTADELLFIAELLESTIDKKTAEIRILQRLTKIPWSVFWNIPAKTLPDVLDGISWIFGQSELTKQLFPTIKCEEIILIGCESGLADFTFEQFFAYSEPAFASYVKNKSDEMLDYLVASIYKLNKKPFDGLLYEHIVELIKSLDKAYKKAVVIFYAGCRDLLAYKFQNIFSTKNEENNKSTEINADNFFLILDSLNGGKLADNEEIKKANLYEALTRIDRMIEEHEKLKNRKNV